MTTKAAFNAEDWAVVTSAPAMTGLLVIAAGHGGTVRESVALSRAYADARKEHSGELLSEVLQTPPGGDGSSAPRDRAELERIVLARLRKAIGLLDTAATPEEVAEYKRFVYGIAEAVANAHKEGGFLGVGGTRVSAEEQAVLDRVAALFDEPPSAPGTPAERPSGDPAEGPPGLA
jgi:hypothetical protein